MDEDAVEYVEITTAVTRGRIVIDLVGERYDIRKPKMHGLIDAVRRLQPGDENTQSSMLKQVAVFGEMEEWLFSCFKPEDAKRIRQRLADDNDDLDVPQIMDAFKAVVEKVSERPILSPSASQE